MIDLKIKFDFDEESLREVMYAELRAGIEATASGVICPEHGQPAAIKWPEGTLPSGDNLRFEAEVCCPKLEALLAEALDGTPGSSEDSSEAETDAEE